MAAPSSMPPGVMLAIRDKLPTEIDLYKPLNTYIAATDKTLPPSSSSDFLSDLDRITDLRCSLTPASTPYLPARRDVLLEYFPALTAISERFPISKDRSHVNTLIFTWYDAFKPSKRASQHNVHFEMAAVLFNVGAVYSQIGLGEDRTDGDGLKLEKGLGVEKQCVADLEKSLHDMRTDCAEIKFTSDQKVQEAQILLEKVEEKSSEAETKLCFADAKIAEIKQRTSELEQELQRLSVREDVLRREHASLINEKQLHLEDLDRQRDDLRVLDRNLREGQERLVMNQSLLNQREERTNQKENVLIKKEKELELLKDALDKRNISLKEEENLISSSLADLLVREKESNIKNETLEKKRRIYLQFTKFWLLLFSYELHRKICVMDHYPKVSILAADPGAVETNIMRELPKPISKLAIASLRLTHPLGTPQVGVSSIIDAALAPPEISGKYFLEERKDDTIFCPFL